MACQLDGVIAMLHCLSATAAAPLLGPSLRRIRSTPLARLAIGYRVLKQQAICRNAPVARAAAIGGCHRLLGHGLLLDRILTGGNQNEGLPLANQSINTELRCGQLFDAVA